MKNFSFGNLVEGLIALVVGMFALGAQAGTIVGSDHDLSALTTNTDQVCVFCHTPHGSDSSSPVPLWNKKLPTGTTYNRYSTLNVGSFDGAEAPVSGSISIACLSCHDGGQAMDVVLNKPGAGGYNGAGSEIDTGAIGTMPGDGIPLSQPIPNLGTDLRDDHPISVQFAGGGCDDTTCTTASINDKDFNIPTQGTASNGQTIWWYDDGDTFREKDEVQFYTRTDFDGTTVEPSVECASCHDVHNGTDLPDVQFMRVTTAASAICVTCHIK